MSKHTPEPWQADRLDTGPGPARGLYISSDGMRNAGFIAKFNEFHPGGDAKANANRVVACVNACAGLPNPTGLPKAIAVLSWMNDAPEMDDKCFDDWFARFREAATAALATLAKSEG